MPSLTAIPTTTGDHELDSDGVADVDIVNAVQSQRHEMKMVPVLHYRGAVTGVWSARQRSRTVESTAAMRI